MFLPLLLGYRPLLSLPLSLLSRFQGLAAQWFSREGALGRLHLHLENHGHRLAIVGASHAPPEPATDSAAPVQRSATAGARICFHLHLVRRFRAKLWWLVASSSYQKEEEESREESLKKSL